MVKDNKEAVEQQIRKEGIKGKEAKLIHALLKGRSKPKGKPSPDWVPKGEELMNNIRYSQMMDYRNRK